MTLVRLAAACSVVTGFMAFFFWRKLIVNRLFNVSRLFALVVVMALSMTASSLAGGKIIRHAGGVNPVDHGWTLVDESAGVHDFKPVQTARPGGGIRAAWMIDTETDDGTGIGAYRKTYPEIAGAWTLRVRLRAIDIDALGGQAIHVGTGVPLPGGETLHYTMQFGMAADGDPLVSLGPGAATYEVDGGANKFIEYTLWVDTRFPGPRSALFIGYTRVGDGGGYGSTDNLIGLEWGDLNPDPAVNGSALWYGVNFRTAIPEPSGFLLMSLAGVGMAFHRRRRI